MLKSLFDSYFSVFEPFQDCPLFNASIKDNIMYSNLEASDDDVIKAVTAAEFKYEKFEDGLHSLVGERGLALSGGEKQRVAIARVFLKQPNAIILDEATSALDSITESQIQKTFVEMAKGKTCLIIAHRLVFVWGQFRLACPQIWRFLDPCFQKQAFDVDMTLFF